MSNKLLLDFVVRSVYFSDLPNLKTAQTLMVQGFQKKTKKPQNPEKFWCSGVRKRTENL
ncbi:hypothetical protein L2E65_17675 [Planktothrix agardhii 1801]|uniref:hypothetical protein n=1 Tax=Planktothrix agardhii TaxID=1160 RepID=UPI001F213C7D|nr:hypothetical protein [Planktothrix agardhii]MCF3626612.1 hypothetical protein [Planktothrix agardhii 1801]